MDHFISSSDAVIVPCGAVVTALFRLLFTLKGEVIKTAKSLGDRSDVSFMFISNVACIFCKLLLFHLSNLIFFPILIILYYVLI